MCFTTENRNVHRFDRLVKMGVIVTAEETTPAPSTPTHTQHAPARVSQALDDMQIYAPRVKSKYIYSRLHICIEEPRADSLTEKQRGADIWSIASSI